MADAQRAQLMANPMASPQRHATPHRTHSVNHAHLAIEPRPHIVPIRLAAQQPGHQQPQPLARGIVAPAVIVQAAQRLDAVVDGAHARRQPEAVGRRGREALVDDDQRGHVGAVVEAVLGVGAVVRAAAQRLVLAAGQRRRDRDLRHGCLRDVWAVRRPVGAGVQRFEVGERGGVVGERGCHDFGCVRERACAQGDEQVGVEFAALLCYL